MKDRTRSPTDITARSTSPWTRLAGVVGAGSIHSGSLGEAGSSAVDIGALDTSPGCRVADEPTMRTAAGDPPIGAAVPVASLRGFYSVRAACRARSRGSGPGRFVAPDRAFWRWVPDRHLIITRVTDATVCECSRIVALIELEPSASRLRLCGFWWSRMSSEWRRWSN